MSDTPLPLQCADWMERSILWKDPDGYVTPNIAHAAKMLREQHSALQEWHEKTEWLRKDLQPHEFGKHLADVLRERSERKDAALATCRSGGHWDCDGDYHETQYFNSTLVKKALQNAT